MLYKQVVGPVSDVKLLMSKHLSQMYLALSFIPWFYRYLDFVNLMSYDFHGSFDRAVGHNAPLRSDDVNDNLTVVMWTFIFVH